MATGGFKPNATTNFLEEWKAKREKVRAKMLGDIAAATGVPLSPTGNPELSASPGNCHTSSHSGAPSSSSSSSGGGALLSRAEEDAHHPVHTPASSLKKAPPQTERASPEYSPPRMACNDSDKESPPPSSKAKEKKSSGPSARKGKGQIEKRKLREKRRSTGVVSIPSNESLDELDDDEGAGEKDRRDEEELVQANTFQNESMTADSSTGYLLETPRSGRHKSSAGQGLEEEAGGRSRQRHNRHHRDGGAGSLEKRLEELETELAREVQENTRLLKAQQDKDDLIMKLKEEINLLNRDLDDIEDENEQLKQENKTLLKVVSQLTR